MRFGRVCETYPDAVFCALLGHRPPPKRTPCGPAAADRGAAPARASSTPTAACGSARLDELDACAVAYAAFASRTGSARGSGDAEEGVIVLPVEELEPAYPRSRRPRRAPLAWRLAHPAHEDRARGALRVVALDVAELGSG